MTKRVKYILLFIIALAGFFMGQRIYEDHELQTNTPTLVILTEDSRKDEGKNSTKEVTIAFFKETKELTSDILDETKEITQDILNGTQKASSEITENLSIEEKTSSN